MTPDELTTVPTSFCLIFVSFLQSHPNLLVRRLHLLFMSTRLRLEFADPFRHGDGTHATLSAADPDRGYNMVDVNADALVSLTRAVMSAISPPPASDCPSRGPTIPTAIAARPPSATHHSDVSSLLQGLPLNIAGPQ